MKFGALASSILLVAVTCCGGPPGAAAEPICRPDSAMAARVHTYFERLEHYGFGGVVRVSRDDCVIIERAYGLADGVTRRPNRVDTAFDLGSISKLLTSSAILRLVDEGRVDLDAPLHRYLSETPPDKAQITIRHLLTHHSGLADDYWEMHRDLETEDEYVQMMLAQPLVTAPGAEFEYNNFGYHLLKRTVERVTGMGFEQYLREQLTLPAGADEIGFSQAGWSASDLAFYQDRTTRRWTELGLDVANALNRPRFFRPEGSGYMYANARSLDVFMRAIGRGAVVNGGWDAYAPPGGQSYGFGLEFGQGPMGRHLGHGGYDDTIGTLARVRAYLDAGVVYVLLSNTHFNGAATSDTFTPVMDALVFGGDADAPPATVEWPADSSALAGRYRGPWGGDIVIGFDRGRLTAEAEGAESVAAMVLPALWDERGTAPDSRIVEAMDAINERAHDRLAPLLSPQFRSESYYEFVDGGWAGIKEALGPVREFRALYDRSYRFGDKQETWRIFASVHSGGRMLFRAVEDEDGLMFFNTFSLPGEFEAVLAPVGSGVFASWNPHLGLAVRFQFAPDGLRISMGDGAPVRLTRIE